MADSFTFPAGAAEPTLPLPTPPATAAPPTAEPRHPRLAAALLVLGAFGVTLAWAPSEVFDLDRYLVPKALALHVAALGLLLLSSVRAPWKRGDRVGLLLALFVGWSAVSAVLATNRWLALSAWGVSFSSLIVFLCARALPERLRRPTLSGVLAAAVVGAALGVAQAYGLDQPWLADSRPPGGTFGNRNFLGHLSAIAAPALLVGGLGARRRVLLLPALLGLAVLAAAIVLTRSRAAWLGSIAGTLVALIALWTAARRAGSRVGPVRLAAGGLAIAAAIATAVALPNELDWTADSPYAATLGGLADYREGSGRGRLIQYGNSLELVPERPVFGVGPGNWFVHYPRVTTPGDPAYAGQEVIPTNPWPSSDWVTFLVERGAAGTVLLLLAMGAAVVSARRAAREPGAASAGAAVAGVLAAALVCGAFDAVLLLAAPSYLTWAAVGLLLPRTGAPAPAPAEDPAAVAPPPPAALRRLALAVSAALLLFTAAHTAAVAMTASSESTPTLRRAALLAPGEHRLHLLLAERGRCANAERAARLMPHHERVARLAAGC